MPPPPPKRPTTRSRRSLAALLLVGCGATAITGMSMLAVYANTPGALIAPPSRPGWLAEHITDPQRHQLAMALHPRCPCSRASVEELSRLLTRVDGRVECLVLAYCPADGPDEFIDSGLIHAVGRLPGVEVLADPDSHRAAELGMRTSGAVVLYAPTGEPAFFGGVTAARGHCGSNLGSDAILSIVLHGGSATTSTPVFGCALHSTDDNRDTAPPCRGGCHDD